MPGHLPAPGQRLGGLHAGEVLLASEQIAVAHGKTAPQPSLDVIGRQSVSFRLPFARASPACRAATASCPTRHCRRSPPRHWRSRSRSCPWPDTPRSRASRSAGSPLRGRAPRRPCPPQRRPRICRAAVSLPSKLDIGPCPPATTIASNAATFTAETGFVSSINATRFGVRDEAHADQIGRGIAGGVARIAHRICLALAALRTNISTFRGAR